MAWTCTVKIRPDGPSTDRGPVEGGDDLSSDRFLHLHDTVGFTDVDLADLLAGQPGFSRDGANHVPWRETVPFADAEEELHPCGGA